MTTTLVSASQTRAAAGLARYLQRFAEAERAGTATSAAWLMPLRRAAMDRFAAVGFPTTRDEDWRFTNVSPIAQTEFRAAPTAPAPLPAEAIAPFLFPGLEGVRLVFVDGRFAPHLSSTGAAAGLVVRSLAEALTAERSVLQLHLGRYAEPQHDPFCALNTAFLEDGAYVSISAGTLLEDPIHLLYVSTAAGAPTMAHPRNLILTGENCQAAILEDYVSLGEGVHFTNSVTELVVGDNGVVSHYHLERENRQAFHISRLRSEQARSSTLTSHSVLLGGALVRRNMHPILAGEGGECLINGLFMPRGRQHMDNFMRVEHASPHCDSRQVFKGILDGQAHGVFHGRIIVHKDAQKTDAKQTNMNLLLSEEAQIDSKPQLEIYADDVKCTHGATIGQINEDAVFYLRSRGLSAAVARALLLFAFAGESLKRMKVAPVRRRLEQLVSEWLPQGNLLEGMD
ncbi:MAG: Fe-S cluster assembly protein SufD [candidate division NC10 bacterium]|nr:Fe-S cluster assembly protein SufD [candidate division NC10 bacterium]